MGAEHSPKERSKIAKARETLERSGIEKALCERFGGNADDIGVKERLLRDKTTNEIGGLVRQYRWNICDGVGF